MRRMERMSATAPQPRSIEGFHPSPPAGVQEPAASENEAIVLDSSQHTLDNPNKQIGPRAGGASILSSSKDTKSAIAKTNDENIDEPVSGHPAETFGTSSQHRTVLDKSVTPTAHPPSAQSFHIALNGVSSTEFYHISDPPAINTQLLVPGATLGSELLQPSPPAGLASSPTSPQVTGQQGDIFLGKPTTYAIKLGYAVERRDLDGKTITIQRFDGPQFERGNIPVPILEQHIVTYETSDIELMYVNIHSPMLINVLRSIIRYTDENLDGNKVQLIQPYKLLYSHEDELRNFKNNHPETHSAEYREECDKHVDFLLKFLDDQERLGRGLRIEKARWRNSPPMATFKNLWLLLRPGDLAFVDRDDALEPYIIQTVTGGPHHGVASPYSVSLFNFDCNGTYFGRAAHTIKIEPFDGEVQVTKLKIFPARFAPNHESMKAKFIERGKKFFQTVKEVTYREYTGSTAQGEKRKVSTPNLDPEYPKLIVRKYDRSRIVIDYSSAPWGEQPEGSHIPLVGLAVPDTAGRMTCYCEACEEAQERSVKNYRPVYDGWDWIKMKTQDGLSDDQYMLCPRLVYGYILKERAYRK